MRPRPASDSAVASSPRRPAGWCGGYTQANLIAVPRDLAWDFLLFAQRNPQPCPVLDVLEAGEVAGPLLTGDIRTDIPLYRVYVDGELADETPDVTRWWRADLVSFLIGCSFTFEGALLDAGVPVRHIEQGVNVPMYRTSRRCRDAGSVGGPMVVSMRPMPADRVADAVRVTARYPAVHGAPVHVGDPRSSASPISTHRTTATRSPGSRATCRCSGRAG